MQELYISSSHSLLLLGLSYGIAPRNAVKSGAVAGALEVGSTPTILAYPYSGVPKDPTTRAMARPSNSLLSISDLLWFSVLVRFDSFQQFEVPHGHLRGPIL